MASYADGKILSESSGPVTTVIINRPEVRNALDNQAARGLAEAFRDFAADEGQRVAVLTGAEGAFCAGADLKEVATDDNYLAWAGDADGPTHPTLEKPVIAAVEGHACAGGLGVALWCDIRVVDETAVFGVFSRRWGVPMSDGTTVRLPRLIGMGRATDMMMTARFVEAKEAYDIGLLSRLVAEDELDDAVLTLADSFAKGPSRALAVTKNAIRRSMDNDMNGEFDYEIFAQVQCLQSETHRERVAAFFKKNGD